MWTSNIAKTHSGRAGLSAEDAEPTVVVAVDDATLRSSLTTMLAPHYRVQTVANGRAALLDIGKGGRCVLIISEALADMDAAQMVQSLNARPESAAVPVVLVRTRGSGAGDRDALAQIPFAAILQPPLAEDQLLATLRTACELFTLRQQKGALSDIVDHFSESFIALDSHWRISHMNTATERELKVHRDQMLGRDAWQLFPETQQSPRAAVYQRCMEERVPAQLEIERPGSGFLQVDAVPLRDGGLGVYFRNATRLRNAETAMERSSQRLRLFLDHAKDYALILLDTEGRVLEWLGGAPQITGWSREQMSGRSLAPLMTPEDKAAGRLEQELREAAEGGTAADTRWHQRQDGSLFFADGITIAMRDESGTLRGFGKLFRDATAEKVEEEAHRQSRERLQRILDSVSDGIFGVAPDRTCIFSNAAAARILGFSAEELAEHPVCDLIGRADENDPAFAQANSHFSRAIEQGIAVHVDGEVFRHKSGRPIPVNYTINPMMANGEIAGVVIAFSDLSAKQKTEAALRESEKRLRFVMDRIPQKIFTTTSAGDADYYNPPWERYSGLSLDELRGEGWTQLVHPDDVQENLKAWKQAVAEGKAFRVEHRLRDKFGNYRWHLSQAAPMRDEEGNIDFWTGSSTDIHEVKSVETDLAQQLIAEKEDSARLVQLAAASRSLNALLSIQQIKTVLTEQARTILGAHQAWVVITLRGDWGETTSSVSFSEKYAQCQDPQASLDASKAFMEVRRLNRPVRLTQDQLEHHPSWRGINTQDSSCSMRGMLAVPLIGHGERNLGFVQISDRFDGEFTADDEAILSQLASIAAVGIENALLYDSLREQDQRKDEFLATLAHELRNPLAPLRSGLDLMSSGPFDERSARVREMMERQLTHMVRLVDDLMDVSRVSRGKVELKREQVDLHSIIHTALETSGPLIGSAKHRIFTELPKQPMIVHGDPTRLAQVLSNLLNNAAKYTPEGGTIELAADIKNGKALVQVKDNGIGIAPHAMSKVFELFTQLESGTDRSTSGLGIGLSLVRKLVEMHGGSVWVESAGLGKGATFTVALPLVDAAGRPQVPADLPLNQAQQATSGRRILVVDDNVEAAQTLAMLLELGGHDVRVAHSGMDALEALEEFAAELVFLDIGLPGMSGYEVAAAVRRKPAIKHIIIVALTGWGSEEDQRRSREAGCDFHLTKPISAADLAQVMARYFPAQRQN